MISDATIKRFKTIVGDRYAVTDVNETAPYLREPRGLYHGSTPLVLRPANAGEISRILALATETGTPIVPQSGNTGHVGGQVPLDEQPAIILSLSRLNAVRSIDLSANALTVDAGCILQDIQKAASDADRLFPLSLGSEGSCQIGGNLSTNAGGTGVLAYGNARNLCLGLEVVLPTGEIWDGLRTLKKDNTGYDLRDLFIGAEGTLGVITGAVLKLLPKPKGKQVAIAGLRSPDNALALLGIAQQQCAGELTGFELMPRIGVEFTSAYIPGVRDPLESQHPWYALIDLSSMRSEEEAAATMETLLATAFEKDLVQDAVIAQSEAQRDAFWHIRETMSEAQKSEGASIKHDVSVPVSAIPEFFRKADKAVHQAMPDARIYAFGHMGDGNIHYNIQQAKNADGSAHLARRHEINDMVYDIALGMGGSISAEHGIGQMKRDKLAAIRQPIEIDLMRRIKTSFDPANIMNPGKIVCP
ncbi:FAD-binding oxidoreductase [Hoeflea sp. WL0058]|uniref:FAD-binding oxidoreductase n=1 Tax=Flavimaribacter sediminis TaxID=2865987 RepID=A0AAE3D1X9_9HYPH|nr:FAD-binding oxidoreductase [Flavimaribacter sediminis]MBW8640175.1 FAD-binding oxidoreductase [Flavimaribacter sediminis]